MLQGLGEAVEIGIQSSRSEHCEILGSKILSVPAKLSHELGPQREFGLKIGDHGYNIYVCGLTGVGRMTLIKMHLEELVKYAQEHGIAIGRKPRSADHSLAFWSEMVGTPGRLFGIIGPTCDCIVVSRPKRKASGPARAFMLAALLHSHKPLLIVPQRPVRLYLWRNGHATRACAQAAR